MSRTKKRVVFACALFVTIGTNIIMSSSSIGQPLLKQYGDGTGMLDFLSYYSGERAVAALGGLGPEGAWVYTRLLLIDFLFIIGTAIIFSMAMRFLVQWARLPSKWLRLHWLGILRSGFDAVENILLLFGLHAAAGSQTVLGVAGIVTLLKWVSMFALVAAALVVTIMGIRNRVKQR